MILGCDFVVVNGVPLPGVSGVEETPVYVGDSERAVSGALRVAHATVAREWRVVLSGVSSVEWEAIQELVMNPLPVGVNVMGVEAIASVTVESVAFVPAFGSRRDVGRRNVELSIKEAVVDQVMPGFTYAYAGFLSTGTHMWDWDAAGKPDRVDVVLIGGGGGGGQGTFADLRYGYGGGGAGGLRIVHSMEVNGDLEVVVGAGGAPGMDGEVTAVSGALFSAAADGGGGGATQFYGRSGGSGGGGRQYPGGSGITGQGHRGGDGNGQFRTLGTRVAYGGGGGGGGAAAEGAAGGTPQGGQRGGLGGAGGTGVDLLALGFNYRLVEGVPRRIGGGGGGGGGGSNSELFGGTIAGQRSTGGLGGGGAGGHASSSAEAGGTDGQPGTGGGGGGASGRSLSDGFPSGGAGGSGLVIIRWLVAS